MRRILLVIALLACRRDPPKSPDPRYGGKTAAEWVPQTADLDSTVRDRAWDALARIGEPAVRPLVAAIESTPDPELRFGAAVALMRMCGDAVSTMIQERERTPSDSARHYLTLAIDEVRSRDSASRRLAGCME